MNQTTDQQILELEALDTLFFRDGKPFTMGQETAGDAVFPPYPSVLYGAIRASWFAESGLTFNPEVIFQETKDLKIKSIGLKIGPENHFPAPLDFIYDKHDKSKVKKARLLQFKSQSEIGGINNASTSHLLYSNKEGEPIQGAVVSYSDLIAYLKGEKSSVNFYRAKDILCREARIGIGRSRQTRSVEEGRLYGIELIRPVANNGERIQLSIGIDGLGFERNHGKGVLRLGGEGKMARYQLVTVQDKLFQPTFVEGLDLGPENILKLYLSTPAIFQDGWLPFQSIEKKSPRSCRRAYDGIPFEILACSVGRPLNIGGWDMAEKEPKPMYRAVPAGSVYYLRTDSKETSKLLVRKLHGEAISHKYPEQGFGIALVGAIQKQEKDV